MRYRVMALMHANAITDVVEANTSEEAIDAYEGWPSLCHQCSNEVELGDIYGFIVEEEDSGKVAHDDAKSWRQLATEAGWTAPEGAE